MPAMIVATAMSHRSAAAPSQVTRPTAPATITRSTTADPVGAGPPIVATRPEITETAMTARRTALGPSDGRSGDAGAVGESADRTASAATGVGAFGASDVGVVASWNQSGLPDLAGRVGRAGTLESGRVSARSVAGFIAEHPPDAGVVRAAATRRRSA